MAKRWCAPPPPTLCVGDLLHTDAQLFTLGDAAAILQMPSVVPPELWSPRRHDTLNILMANTSSSLMETNWADIVRGWNWYIRPILLGRTDMYAFNGHDVLYLRSDPYLFDGDYHHSYGDQHDATDALSVIGYVMNRTREQFVNVFFITDGFQRKKPDFRSLTPPPEKVCQAFIIGVGGDYPVSYGFQILSYLHNGSSYIRSHFRAKTREDIPQAMSNIAQSYVSAGGQGMMILSTAGCLLPGMQTRRNFFVKEWVYFSHRPKIIMVANADYIGRLPLEPYPISVRTLVEKVVPQWCGIIERFNGRRQTVPRDVVSLVELLLPKKNEEEEHHLHNGHRSWLRRIRCIMIGHKFQNETEQARTFLKVMVRGNDPTLFAWKGHTDDDHKKDVEAFLLLHKLKRKELMDIVEENDADRCCITLDSTLQDLQNPKFQDMAKRLNKFEFLNFFNMTGIPVFAPVRDSVFKNPWSFTIEALVSAHYPIVSHVVLQNYADRVGYPHKDVVLQCGDPASRYNAVIPTYTPAVARIMSFFSGSRMYATCVTYAITKNPHVVDFDLHMAALAVTWMKCLSNPRPEYMQQRIECIEATATMYMDRYAEYCMKLQTETSQALMTECTGQPTTIRCETLVKPMFLLHLTKKTALADVKRIISTMIVEFIGRCLSKYRGNGYKNFFYVEIPKDPGEWMSDDEEEEDDSLNPREMKMRVRNEVQRMRRHLVRAGVVLNRRKVEHLRNIDAAGDLTLRTLRDYAKVMGMTDKEVDEMFGEMHLSVCVVHGLKNRTSWKRMSLPVSDYVTSMADVLDEYLNEILETYYGLRMRYRPPKTKSPPRTQILLEALRLAKRD